MVGDGVDDDGAHTIFIFPEEKSGVKVVKIGRGGIVQLAGDGNGMLCRGTRIRIFFWGLEKQWRSSSSSSAGVLSKEVWRKSASW